PAEGHVVAGDGTCGEFVDNGKTDASADECGGDIEGSDRYSVLQLDLRLGEPIERALNSVSNRLHVARLRRRPKGRGSLARRLHEKLALVLAFEVWRILSANAKRAR